MPGCMVSHPYGTKGGLGYGLIPLEGISAKSAFSELWTGLKAPCTGADNDNVTVIHSDAAPLLLGWQPPLRSGLAFRLA
jgi:hypothetical protein